MLGLNTFGFASAGASAAAMLPLTSSEANAASGVIVQVMDQKNRNNFDGNRKWDKRFGKRCNHYNDNCRHHYRGHYYENPWWNVPMIIGDGIGPNNYYDNDDEYDYGDDYDGGGLSRRHVRYCLNKYRSYNPRNNTWMARGGQMKRCYSPYM